MSNNIMIGILTVASISLIVNIYTVCRIWMIEDMIQKVQINQSTQLTRLDIMKDSLHDCDKNVRSLVVIKDSLDAKELFLEGLNYGKEEKDDV